MPELLAQVPEEPAYADLRTDVTQFLKAVTDVSFSIGRRETLALVREGRAGAAGSRRAAEEEFDMTDAGAEKIHARSIDCSNPCGRSSTGRLASTSATKLANAACRRVLRTAEA